MSDCILFGDPRWSTTLPHRVQPVPDEWLVGLVLRCDLVNGWAAGTTARGLHAHPISLTILGEKLGAFAYARTIDLSRLAGLLAVPVASLRQTTFEAGLERLRAPGQLTPRRIVVGRPFRVCPECIISGRLIARSHALPMVYTCQEHETLLGHKCRCDSTLRPFHGAAPFTCPNCSVSWADLPVHGADADTLALDARLLSLYRFFLERGGPDSIGNALRAVSDEMARRGIRRLPPIPREAPLPGDLWEKASVSLTRVVGAMAALELMPEAARPPTHHRVPASLVSCLNRICPHFGAAGAGNVHPLRRKDAVDIYYCSECGSHFSRDRIYSSFDYDCSPYGDPPSRSEVAEERMRLSAWREALEEVCIGMVAVGIPITVNMAFEGAGVARRPRLRAGRLRLVGMVEDYAALQASGVRERILAEAGDGLTGRQVAEKLGVSLVLVRRVLALRPKMPKGRSGRPRRIKVEEHDMLRAQLEAHPTAPLAVHVELWSAICGTSMNPTTMSNTIRRLGWARSNGHWQPPPQENG